MRNDPRSPATSVAVAAQHALQQRIVSAMRGSWDGQQQVAAVRAALAQAVAGVTDPEVTGAVTTLRAAIDAAVGPESGRSSGAAASPPTFSAANETLAGQLNAQDNGDFAPTPAMLAAFDGVCRDLSTVRSAWQRVLQRDMPTLNAVLVRKGASAIPVPNPITWSHC